MRKLFHRITMQAVKPYDDSFEASLLYPKKFFLLLFELGLFNVAHDAPNRQQTLLGVMRQVLDLLSNFHPEPSENQTTPVTIVGQTHDDSLDADYALKWAQSIGLEQEEYLMLERDGNLHPKLHGTNELPAAAGKNAIIVKEKDVLGDGLNTLERSWLIGLYLANLIATGSQRPITLIIGENHSKDIEIAIYVCLQYMRHSPAEAVISTELSSNQTIPAFSGLTLTLEMLCQSEDDIVYPEVKTELPCIDPNPDDTDKKTEDTDESGLASSHHFPFWTPPLITISSLLKKFRPKEIGDIKYLLVEEAQNHGLEEYELRKYIEKSQNELIAIVTANQLLNVISEQAHLMWEEKTTHHVSMPLLLR